MISIDEARAIAQEWARGYHGDATVTLEPFDLGYVVRRTAPELADWPRLVFDAQVTAVVDGRTGAVTGWPSVPLGAVMQLYRDRIDAEARFSPHVLGLLGLAGWRPGREIGVIVDGWWWRCAPPDANLPPAVRSVLAEFGGIALRTAQLSMLPDPTDTEVEFVPVGQESTVVVGHQAGSAVTVDEHGATYLSTDHGTQRIADSFDAALGRLLGLVA